MLAMVGALIPAGAGAQATGSITIYKSQCPVGYEGTNYGRDCYPNPMGDITFTLTPTGNGDARTATTGPSGFTFFDALNGEYTLEEEIPGDFNSFVVFCSVGATGEEFPVGTAADNSRVLLTIGPTDDIRCDWYNIPADAGQPGTDESASVSIYKTTCPVGYEGEDYFEDCYDNPTEGVTFFLSEAGADVGVASKTDAEGFAGFADLDAGTYVLSEDVPGEFADFVAYCSAGGATFPFEYATDVNGIVFDLTTEDVRCDFYNIPEDLRGETPAATAAPTAVPTKATTTTTTTITVARLPSTGAGASDSGTAATLALAGLLAAFGLGLAGFSWRTRSAHRTR